MSEQEISSEEMLLALVDGGENALARFSERFYRLGVEHVRTRATFLAGKAAKLLGQDGLLGREVSAADRAALAHDVAVTAVRRVAANAGKFDPARGNALSYFLGALSQAYVDATRDQLGARRKLQVIPVEDTALAEIADAAATSPDPANIVVARDKFERAMQRLTGEEQKLLLLTRRHGLTREEAARAAFPELPTAEGCAKASTVLKSARRKLDRMAAEERQAG